MNNKIVEMLTGIIRKLKTTRRDNTLILGRGRAEEIRSICIQKGVFGWCPRLSVWLDEVNYIIYQGILRMNP